MKGLIERSMSDLFKVDSNAQSINVKQTLFVSKPQCLLIHTSRSLCLAV